MTTTSRRARALKFDLAALRLASGAHTDPAVGMCVMELTSFLAHEPFSDHPACASPVISAFLRSWNDSVDDEFRQKLKPYAERVISTKTTAADEEKRAWLATDWLVRVQTPAWLELAGLPVDARVLRELPPLTSSEIAVAVQSVLDRVRSNAAAAWDAAWAAARDAASAAARDAARDAASAAAWDAAWDAAWAAARDAASAAAWDAARDAASAAAWDAAWDAAKQRLAPTVTTLQASAFTLLDAMIAVGKSEEAELVGA